MGHIDDSLLIAQSYSECAANINDTVDLFTKLGFRVHPEKSILIPTHEIEFVGFIMNSLSMSVRLSVVKAAKVHEACKNILNRKHITIRGVAQVIGLLVSSLPAVRYGELYYRKLEVNKSNALRKNHGDFVAEMTLSEESKSELLWWISNVNHAQRPLVLQKPDLFLTTDASLLGWGAVSNGKEKGGQWSSEEQSFHINYLEMKALLLGLQSLCRDAHDTHICIESDNTTAVSYLNVMGGVKSEQCHNMAIQIWE